MRHFSHRGFPFYFNYNNFLTIPLAATLPAATALQTVNFVSEISPPAYTLSILVLPLISTSTIPHSSK